MPEKKRKAELLSPAGDIDGAAGAINAGADAIYLGTEEFSARAYAKNLTIEETIEMIHYAHLYHRKLYLTMNTLLKTVEFSKALSILDRLYLAGLDAVIVQDLGLLSCLHQYFPELEIHVSTQLSILSAAGMKWLKEYHVTRVVPGRELSLTELREMKKTGLELECFIHGAMCYAYSGRCLMSSLAGGRSGNRGRCAGPCRKQYHQPGQKDAYLLSMKDMCSIDQIKALMDAGIDSFKIEGRMKAAEYTAGVTSVYRKVIDRIENGEKYVVTKDDRTVLEELYIRSEIQEGYYFRHNSKDMISLSDPAYAGCSDALKEDIHRRYLEERRRYPIQGEITVCQGRPMKMTLQLDGHEESVEGAVAVRAEKRAISDADIQKQICKTGNTLYEISKLKIVNDGTSFAAVSQLKDLRRSAIEKLEQAVFSSDRQSVLQHEGLILNKLQVENRYINKQQYSEQNPAILIGVKTKEQLKTVLRYSYADGVIIDLMMFTDTVAELLRRISENRKKWYLRLPEIIRQKDIGKIREQLEAALAFTDDMPPEGIYCSGIDALRIAGEFLGRYGENSLHGNQEIRGGQSIVADQGIYIMNESAENAVLKHAASYTAPLELNRKELSHAIRKDARELIVYGYLPMMYSANCIVNTTDGCDRTKGTTRIIDQEGREFPVLMNHDYCYNTIYNCVPLSLHQEVSQLYQAREAAAFRMEFTIEDAGETDRILGFFQNVFSKGTPEGTEKDTWKGYTKGHFNRGVL
ncbi:MAG: U32 family peptidase [Lachnospiraceae bacterium]|nr:U32 family peptidase [Lachnospiraceae bacterium]